MSNLRVADLGRTTGFAELETRRGKLVRAAHAPTISSLWRASALTATFEYRSSIGARISYEPS